MFFFWGGVGWGVGRDPKSNLQISDFKRMASVHLGYSCHLPTTRLLTKWHAPACTVSFHVVSSKFLNFLYIMIVLCIITLVQVLWKGLLPFWPKWWRQVCCRRFIHPALGGRYQVIAVYLSFVTLARLIVQFFRMALSCLAHHIVNYFY